MGDVINAMYFIEILSVPAIILLGIITSYQDIKQSRIKNGWIAIALAFSLFLLGLMALITYLEGGSINLEYLRIYFVNLGISLAFGIFLWVCKLWSPGDAKLFLAYAALIPLSYYSWGFNQLFPSYVLLINTFTPIFVFFLARLLVRLSTKEVLAELKKVLNPKLLANFALFVFGFSAVGRILFGILDIQTNYLLDMVFLLFLMLFFSSALKVDLLKVSIVFSVVRLVLDFQFLLQGSFWLGFLKQMAGFVILQYFVLNLGFRAFSKPVYIEKLEPGMCLAEDITEENGEIKKRSTISMSFMQSIFDNIRDNKSILADYSSITKEEIAKIRMLHSEGRLKDHALLTYEKMSFAIFMFAGAVITIVFRGNMLIVIRVLVEKFI